jgi:hypothetical protein
MRKTGQPISLRQDATSSVSRGPRMYRSRHGQGVLDHPAAQLDVGDVDRVVVAGMRGHRQLGRRQCRLRHAAGRMRRLGDGQADQCAVASGREQLVVVQPAGGLAGAGIAVSSSAIAPA